MCTARNASGTTIAMSSFFSVCAVTMVLQQLLDRADDSKLLRGFGCTVQEVREEMR